MRQLSWTKTEEQKLIKLASRGEIFYSEMVPFLNKKAAAIRWKARKLRLPTCPCSEKWGRWNVIHKDLRLEVMTYFLNHTAEQTCKKFKLTVSQFKSLMTVGYRKPEFRHLRKETRRHDSWSSRELRFLITRAGILPREFIGRALRRGTAVCIKERLESLGLSSRTLNGITLTQFRSAFGTEPRLTIKTQAGPNGTSDRGPTNFKIVPWAWLDEELKTSRLEAPKTFRELVSAMAIFQNWIYQGNTIRKMKTIARTRIDKFDDK
jgi:hypothetical protein